MGMRRGGICGSANLRTGTVACYPLSRTTGLMIPNTRTGKLVAAGLALGTLTVIAILIIRSRRETNLPAGGFG